MPADAPPPRYLGPKLRGLGVTPIQVAPVVLLTFPVCSYVNIKNGLTSVEQCLKAIGLDAGTLAANLASEREAGVIMTPQQYLEGAFPGSCTGTFIAKNWILTAAHCLLGNMPPFTDGSGRALNSDITSDAGALRYWLYNVTIDWAHGPNQGAGEGTAIPLVDGVGQFPRFGTLTAGDGPNVAGELNTSGLAYVHPNFLGYSNGTPGATSDIAHDVALFYLPTSDDGFLPSDPNTGSAMPISLIPPAATDSPSFFGWGAPTVGDLNEGNFPGMKFDAQNTFTPGLTLDLIYPSNWPGPFLCTGDSGGPGVRQLAVSIGGGAAQRTAIVGTESSGSGIGACTPPGGSDSLVRTDMILASFIEPNMRDYETDDFSCVRLTEDTSNGVQTYAECWKKACLVDSDCALAKYRWPIVHAFVSVLVTSSVSL